MTARRAGDRLVVAYEAPPEATALVVATRPRAQAVPATTRAFALDAPRGEIELEGDVEVWVSVVGPDGAASEGVRPQGAG